MAPGEQAFWASDCGSGAVLHFDSDGRVRVCWPLWWTEGSSCEGLRKPHGSSHQWVDLWNELRWKGRPTSVEGSGKAVKKSTQSEKGQSA